MPDRNVTVPTRSSPFIPFSSLYALTSIFQLTYIKSVESVFDVIAEPNRRAILSLLALDELPVGEIERKLCMTQPAVSKHLRVLREAGFVEATVDAQRRLYRLRPEPLRELDTWLEQFRRLWSRHLDALERHLDRMEQSRKGKTANARIVRAKRKPKEPGDARGIHQTREQ
jgi:DNA-binding transcriptional ArsR family regulator